LPFLKNFGIEDGLEMKITKRGAHPLGGGEVIFKCGVIKNLKSVNLVNPGKIKRVRGIAYTTKVNPMIATRVVSSARELLNNFIPDVWIFTDHSKGPSSGL
jgi:RNA 3'-terminal phosphate cyclase-like protein